ncbi:MAG: IgGFc-binding protein [Myxococcales bacterium]|nr:IgGFc-binding protein [Myxococcales bacterium]
MRRSFARMGLAGVFWLGACGGTGGTDDPLLPAGGAGGQGGSSGAHAGTSRAAGGTSGSSGQAGGSGASGQGGGTVGQGGASGGDAGTAGAGAAGAGGEGGAAGGGAAGGGGAPCAAGTILCNGGTKQVCDGNGGFSEEVVCDKFCAAGLGCVECLPATGTCEGNKALRCRADGSGYDTKICDVELGLSCQAANGTCQGPCSPENLNRSYIGCEYFPTVTSNGGLFSGFNFAIVVANTSNEEAVVTVRRGDQVVEQTSVAPNSLQTIKLPWVEALRNDYSKLSASQIEGALKSKLVTGGAYYVKATRPVTVYQFNPLEFQIPDPGGCPKPGGGSDCNSYTNDASLLLPVNALGDEYFVASMTPLISAQASLITKTYLQLPGFFAVTATDDDTDVIVTSSAYVRGGDGVQEMAPGGSQTFKLHKGDVLQLLAGKVPDNQVQGCVSAGLSSEFCSAPKTYDLTGTLVASSKPVMVLGGSDCARVPYSKAACDHLEETMFPVNTLGTEVIVTAPQAVKSAAAGDGKPDPYMLRVLSAVDNNQIKLDPPIAPGGTLNRGAYADVPLTDKDVMVKATGPVLVVQYMLSADQVDPGNSGTAKSQGDPAFSLGIPSVQYRTEYTFLAPESYTQNFVNIVGPTGSVVSLDGQDIVLDGPPIGATGFTVLRKKILGGPHTATSKQPFGIVVYGYGRYTSYMYPGGLNLNKL